MVVSFAPDAPLVISAGFDTFERDPIGDLALRTADYEEIGRMIRALSMPMVVLQEGGYAVDALGANTLALLTGLRGA
jgi:acetoin utilization deacetylase AcuC-like enzyme